MREILCALVVIGLIIMLFAYEGDPEAVGFIDTVWQTILGSVKELGEAWRGAP